MPFISENLNLPYIAPAQAQKHVTHNEAIRMLDALVQLSLSSKTTAVPPITPTAGERYFVPSGASGDWGNKAGTIAAYQDGAWSFHSPQIGWQAYLIDEQILQVWDGQNWQDIGGAPDLQNLDHIGINTSADTVNRLAVASPASLLNHDGAGHQLKINKNTAADTGSVLLQTGYSGRAEIGLTGDDDFHFKTSSDGSQWRGGLTIHASSGIVSKPSHPYIYGTLGAMVVTPARQVFIPKPQSDLSLISQNNTRLTAPVAGLYMFTAAQLSSVTNGYMYWYLFHNGSIKYQAFQHSSAFNNRQHNNHIVYIAHMNAGEYLELASNILPSTSYTGVHSQFAFTLIG